jgi:hypothetical protein
MTLSRNRKWKHAPVGAAERESTAPAQGTVVERNLSREGEILQT